jgi:hypothetical protein
VKIPDWADAAPKTVSANLPMCPDGEHSGEIIAVESKRLDFMRGEGNAAGECLDVTVDVSGYQHVEVLVAAHWRGKMEAVARAAGVPVPQPKEEWDEAQLIGRQVRIKTVIGPRKGGGERVNVEKWLPSPSQKIAAPKPPPAAPRRTAAPAPTGDDIPFAFLLAVASLLGGMA